MPTRWNGRSTPFMGCAKAHAATGTPYRSVALEHLAQSYLGTGLQFSDWKSALLYHRKHSSDPATFLHAVLEYQESICPEATITAENTLADQAAGKDARILACIWLEPGTHVPSDIDKLIQRSKSCIP
jgi:hypothetical protein